MPVNAEFVETWRIFQEGLMVSLSGAILQVLGSRFYRPLTYGAAFLFWPTFLKFQIGTPNPSAYVIRRK